MGVPTRRDARGDTRRWKLTGDPAQVTNGPPIMPGTTVLVIPEAEAERQRRAAVEEVERLRAWIATQGRGCPSDETIDRLLARSRERARISPRRG